MAKSSEYILSSGKRKAAIARVRLKEDSKNPIVRINGMALDAIENEHIRARISEPLTLIGDIYKNNLNIKIRVQGGGVFSQADAIRTGLARALSQYYKSAEVDAIFNEYDRALISGDMRRREPKKAGGRGARARFQKSYR